MELGSQNNIRLPRATHPCEAKDVPPLHTEFRAPSVAVPESLLRLNCRYSGTRPRLLWSENCEGRSESPANRALVHENIFDGPRRRYRTRDIEAARHEDRTHIPDSAVRVVRLPLSTRYRCGDAASTKEERPVAPQWMRPGIASRKCISVRAFTLRPRSHQIRLNRRRRIGDDLLQHHIRRNSFGFAFEIQNDSMPHGGDGDFFDVLEAHMEAAIQ